MKRINILIALPMFLFFTSCSKSFENKMPDVQIKSLKELVNEGVCDKEFYDINFVDINSNFKKGLVYVLPSSSCFNCFEEVNLELKAFYETYPDHGLIIIKNSKIKDREVLLSLENIIKKDKISFIEINNSFFISQHEFFPKLGCYFEGKICCFEVFLQSDSIVLQKYFEFIRLVF